VALRSVGDAPARESTVIVILAAGKASRLGGTNKLLVEAAGMPVHEWHRRAVGNEPTYAVVRSDDVGRVLSAAPWLSGVIPHDEADGPSGALLSASTSLPDGALTVLFSDTLLPEVPMAEPASCR
jgi:CTP:molybdopterin cytidylyltransferase MocA